MTSPQPSSPPVRPAAAPPAAVDVYSTQPDREARNPLFRWVMHLGLPGMISLALHLLVFALMAFKTWEVFSSRNSQWPEYAVGIAEHAGGSADGELDWRGEKELPQADADLATKGESYSFGGLPKIDKLDVQDAGRGEGVGPSGGLGIGEGGRSGVLGTGGGLSGGSGEFGAGTGDGRSLGRARMWGVSVRANKVCYVIDFSGSMIVVKDQLVRELKRSVGGLKAPQSFNVFVFYERRGQYVTEGFSSTLEVSSPATNRRFFEWIDQKAPMGPTEPLGAVRRALALRPDAVFFFSDGEFEDSVVGQIADANRATKASISCLYLNESLLADSSGLPPRLDESAARMQRIAEQSRGRLKVLTGTDLR